MSNKNQDKWKFYKDKSSEWRWTRIARNGEIVGAASEGYKNWNDCFENAKRNGYSAPKRPLGAGNIWFGIAFLAIGVVYILKEQDYLVATGSFAIGLSSVLSSKEVSKMLKLTPENPLAWNKVAAYLLSLVAILFFGIKLWNIIF